MTYYGILLRHRTGESSALKMFRNSDSTSGIANGNDNND